MATAVPSPEMSSGGGVPQSVLSGKPQLAFAASAASTTPTGPAPPTLTTPPIAAKLPVTDSNTSLVSSSAGNLNSGFGSSQLLYLRQQAPLIIVHPPEEDGDEPSISFAPNEKVSGLPNPGKTRVQSALNATLQVFMAVPEMTEELPFASSIDSVQRFVSTVRYVHCEASKVADLSSVDLDWWREVSGLPKKEDPLDDNIETISDYEKVSRGLVDKVLGHCRIGRKFLSEKKSPDAPKTLRNKDSTQFFSASSLLSDTDSIVDLDADAKPSKAAKAEDEDDGTARVIALPLQDYGENETIGVIALLNKVLGLQPQPTFFFGYGSGMGGGGSGLVRNSIFASDISKTTPSTPSSGPSAAASSNSGSGATTRGRSGTLNSKPAGPSYKFIKLPELLVLSFKRPLSQQQAGVYHRTAVEMPMDLDLGFAFDTAGAKRRDQQLNQTSSGKERSTFYKLHGFVTQTEGRFLAYTRSLGGYKWYKCEDEVVAEADLGARVASKGVLLALYRLQEKRH
ncbi:hypothetical protein HDU96_008417 [Phlyctochytrium bullatum]|nr:hypothetical protein HDU96_008417 [Phlyctochytrium bullatum]